MQDKMKNAAVLAGVLPQKKGGSNPYTGVQNQYFATGTQDYVWDNAQYASNYFKAKVQGCIPGDFATIRGAYIRTMDIVEQSTGSNAPNDWQLVYFQDPKIKGLYTGAKLWYAGNTWIATSPMNMANLTANSVIRRCNAVWNYLDYYGNVKSEPFVWSKGPAQATANEHLDYMVVPNSYQKCVMQLNDATREIAYNRRMVLGSSVYEVRGIVDFMCDFSGESTDGTPPDNRECHILFFDLVYQQPIAIDDMEKELAGGKAFQWEILVSGMEKMSLGGMQTLNVRSLRNGEAPDGNLHPVSYRYESSNEDVVQVDNLGQVLAVGEGDAEITVILTQNEKYRATFHVHVMDGETGTEIVVTPALPESMGVMDSYHGKVVVRKDGAVTDTAASLAVNGAAKWAYNATLDGENNLTINCYGGSEKPLEIKIQADDAAFEASIRLKGI